MDAKMDYAINVKVEKENNNIFNVKEELDEFIPDVKQEIETDLTGGMENSCPNIKEEIFESDVNIKEESIDTPDIIAFEEYEDLEVDVKSEPLDIKSENER